MLIRTNSLNPFIEEAVRLIPIISAKCELDVIHARAVSIDSIMSKFNPFIRIECAKLKYHDVVALLDYFINAMTAGTGDYYRMANIVQIRVNFTDGSFSVEGDCYDFS